MPFLFVFYKSCFFFFNSTSRLLFYVMSCAFSSFCFVFYERRFLNSCRIFVNCVGYVASAGRVIVVSHVVSSSSVALSFASPVMSILLRLQPVSCLQVSPGRLCKSCPVCKSCYI